MRQKTRRRKPAAAGSADARELAYQLLRRWEDGEAYIDDLLAEVDHPDLRERRLVQELSCGVIRQHRRLNHVLDYFCREGIDSLPGGLRCLLRLGAYQILFSDRIPAYAAIDESVRLAKEFGFGSLAGVVNAVLRQVEAQHGKVSLPDRESEPIRYLGVAYSFPDWMVARFVEQFGEQNAEVLLRRANQPPPLHVRVNRLKATPEKVIRLLNEEGVRAGNDRVVPHCLAVELTGPVAALGTFREGYFQVQDRSAQLVAPVVDPQPGEVILDACSAPGGKTTHLAELMSNKGTVLAVDRTADRLDRVRENARRLGLSNIVTHVSDWSGEVPFLSEKVDRILVDAPCSGLGTLGRRVDLRWRLQPDAFEHLAGVQLQLLNAVASHLKRGGVLVYSTCTLAPEENRNVVQTFLNGHPEFRFESAQPYLPGGLAEAVAAEGFIDVLPHRDDMDGGFIARLVKTGSSTNPGEKVRVLHIPCP